MTDYSYWILLLLKRNTGSSSKINGANIDDIPNPITYTKAYVCQPGRYTLSIAIVIWAVPVPHKYKKTTTYFSSSPVKNLETKKNERVANAP